MARRINRQLQEARRAAEREKDTIYFLDFTPKDGHAVARTTLLDDPWLVRLPKDPKGDQGMIDEAIKAFEAKHQVKSWSEIASRYQVNGLYYP